MTLKQRRAVTALLVTGFACVAGCRANTVPPAAVVPQSPETARARAQEEQTQKYILSRRATARKNNPGHSVH